MNAHAERCLLLLPSLEQLGRSMPIDLKLEEFVEGHSEKISPLFTYSGSELSAGMHCAYHLCKYFANDCKDFFVMPYLSECLEKTSLNADPRMLNAPFPEFCIEPPPGFGKIFNDKTGMHSIEVFYVSFYEQENCKMIRILVIGRKNENSLNEYDDALFFFKCPVYMDRSIEQSFEEAYAKMYEIKETATYDIDGEHNLQETKRFFKYCLNVILYSISINANKQWKTVYPFALEMKLANLQDENRKRKLRKLNQHLARKKCILGAGLARPKVSILIQPTEEEKYKLSKRILVTAHYQGYWVGAGENKILTPMWKETYWKGPELADTIHNSLEVVQ